MHSQDIDLPNAVRLIHEVTPLFFFSILFVLAGPGLIWVNGGETKKNNKKKIKKNIKLH